MGKFETLIHLNQMLLHCRGKLEDLKDTQVNMERIFILHMQGGSSKTHSMLRNIFHRTLFTVCISTVNMG